MLWKAHGYWAAEQVLKRINVAKLVGFMGWRKRSLPTAG